MSVEDRVIALIDEGNPIPDPNELDRDRVDAAAYLATLESRSSAVTRLSTRHKDTKEKKMGAAAFLGAAAAVILAGIGVFLLTHGNNVPFAGQPSPATVLADYLEVWNSEDAKAVMVFYAEDAVIEGHPEDSDGLATGKSEILVIEEGMQRRQGSKGTMEFMNIEVSGDTVTFDNIFHNAAGLCFSSAGSEATVENGLITLIVWGDTNADLCP